MSLLPKTRTLSVLLTLIITLQSAFAIAYDETTERRINIGLRLFRTILASDINLNKKINQDNQFNLILVSSSTKEISETQTLADKFLNLGRGSKKAKIHGFPIKLSIFQADQLNNFPDSPVAGIYIADKLSEQQLQTVINFGHSQQCIVYSPFEGDVENGVTAGLAVGIRVLPFINTKALKTAGITIKALILKVAKIYED